MMTISNNLSRHRLSLTFCNIIGLVDWLAACMKDAPAHPMSQLYHYSTNKVHPISALTLSIVITLINFTLISLFWLHISNARSRVENKKKHFSDVCFNLACLLHIMDVSHPNSACCATIGLNQESFCVAQDVLGSCHCFSFNMYILSCFWNVIHYTIWYPWSVMKVPVVLCQASYLEAKLPKHSGSLQKDEESFILSLMVISCVHY